MKTQKNPIIVIRKSQKFEPVSKKKPFFKRAFSKMEKGGLRGNVFLFILTTTGCSFTLLPYFAKQSGLLLITILLIIPALVSYFSSMILYWGFKATQAKDYGECMKKIMGPRIGFASNIVIFCHTFGSVVSCWMFSFRFINSALVSVLNFSEVEKAEHFSKIFMYSFFYFIFFLLFVTSIFGGIEKLKKLSIIGLTIMLYIIAVIVFQMPSFFDYNNSIEPIVITPYIIDMNIFKAWGLCSFLFLNQYAVLPICNNLRRLCNKRMSKVVGRTILFSFFLYATVLYAGYFSLPNNLEDCPPIFLDRKPLPGKSDFLLWLGTLLFGINLLIGLLIKNHFFILYFHQILKNIAFFWKEMRQGKKIVLIIEEKKDENKTEVEIKDVDEKVDIELNTIEKETIETNLVKEEIKKEDSEYKSDNEKKDADYNSDSEVDEEDDSTINPQAIKRESRFDLLTEDLKHKNSSKKKAEKKSIKQIIVNFFFLFIITNLALALQNKLKEFVSLIGSFVGIFEIIILPFTMILVINKYNKILKDYQVYLLIFVGATFVMCGIASIYVTLTS